jgi:hypothetical protein
MTNPHRSSRLSRSEQSVRELRAPISETILAGYFGAFRAANPFVPLPHVTYENGWYVFRSNITGHVQYRHRAAKLIEMTCTLAERARQSA